MRKMLTHQKENDKLKYGKLLRERKVDTMIEVTESSLSQYVFHQVDEQLTIGDTVYITPEVVLEAAFTQLAFSKIKYDQQYTFFHESEVALNELYTYAKRIFADEKTFLEQSQQIATHLHSVSTHPNINHGDLFVGLFKDCLIGDTKRQVLSIVKIDEKELFLDVQKNNEHVTVDGIDGINVKKVNNAAVIIDMGEDEEPAVFIRTRKKEDVVYWQERFLKVKVADEAYEKTNLALKEVKKIILTEEETTNTEKLQLLNKTLSYFKNAEEFVVDQYIDEVFGVPDEVQKDVITNRVKPYETVISEPAIEQVEKSYKRKIKLDDSIEIVVHVQDVEAIDEKIQHGYEEDTGRHYYKVYYEEES